MVKSHWPVLLLAPWAAGMAGAASLFDVGDRAQLFVDKVLVRSAQNVVFTLHPAEKRPRNPLLTPDLEFGRWRIALCSSMLYDDAEQLKHCMFASVLKDSTDPDPERRTILIRLSPLREHYGHTVPMA